MNIGLPGTGIGGLFYLLMALLMPLAELAQTLRGRGSARGWQTALRQSGLAMAVIGSMWFTGWLINTFTRHSASSSFLSVSGQVSRAIGVTPTVWSFGALGAVLLSVEIGRFLIIRSAGRIESTQT